MKEQVENLLRVEKERIIASDKQKRENHLLSLGLIDQEKTSRIYSDYQGLDYKFDEEKKKYYTERVEALDVTDEEYIEICKYFPPSKKVDNLNNQSNTKKILFMFLGILCILIGIIIFGSAYRDDYSLGDNLMRGLGSTFILIVGGLIITQIACKDE